MCTTTPTSKKSFGANVEEKIQHVTNHDHHSELLKFDEMVKTMLRIAEMMMLLMMMIMLMIMIVLMMMVMMIVVMMVVGINANRKNPK